MSQPYIISSQGGPGRRVTSEEGLLCYRLRSIVAYIHYMEEREARVPSKERAQLLGEGISVLSTSQPSSK
jgi:hypothetical protein